MGTQLKKGVLDLCILSILVKEDSYGYNIYQLVNQYLTISESTIYPILRKFVKEGYCTTYLKESPGGPARKYFVITSDGKKRYKEVKKEWTEFKVVVDRILGGFKHE